MVFVCIEVLWRLCFGSRYVYRVNPCISLSAKASILDMQSRIEAFVVMTYCGAKNHDPVFNHVVAH